MATLDSSLGHFALIGVTAAITLSIAASAYDADKVCAEHVKAKDNVSGALHDAQAELAQIEEAIPEVVEEVTTLSLDAAYEIGDEQRGLCFRQGEQPISAPEHGALLEVARDYCLEAEGLEECGMSIQNVEGAGCRAEVKYQRLLEGNCSP